MAIDELADRLATAAAGIEALHPAVAAGEPWPLSDDYGTEPESAWGPKEVLAHVAEMLPYWLGQVETILASPSGAGPPPFGRVATDEKRLYRIGADRRLPASELVDQIGESAATVRARLLALMPAELERSAVHPRLGEMTVPAIYERFIIGHLEEHVRQLGEVLGRS
ncbi:MAG TPA: DinB family protein [Candidatus Limnocylindrales bacterium]|nr:DinB family protein [Candidatus Limnocylindrales bacterium]